MSKISKSKSDEDQKEDNNIIQALFSCSSYLETSDFMKNLELIFVPLLIYSGSDKIIVMNMINGYNHKNSNITIEREERIKETAKIFGLNVLVMPMIYEYFIDHIFKRSFTSFFYDYIFFIGCNNFDFIFSFMNPQENKELEQLLMSKIGTNHELDGLEQYPVTENFNLFLKPCSKILFFEKGRYWDTLDFHRQLLDQKHRARKHADIFLQNFKLKHLPTRTPYFVYKFC